MTSTQFTVGIGEGCRVSSKVLKPPGGGSSDIFGLGSYAAGKSSSEKHSKSEDSSTNSRIFGVTNTSLPPQNGIHLNTENAAAAAAPPPPPPKQAKTYVRRNPITGEEIEITLEAETDDKNNCNNEHEVEESSNVPSVPTKPVQTSIRVRNPPGGKSSGIF